jgi:phosphoglycolate phosphatase
MALGVAETAPAFDRRHHPLPTGPLAGATIAFDLDGALVDSAPDLIGVLNVILADHGHPALPMDSARWVVGHGARAMLGRGFAAVGETLEEARMDALFERFIELYRGRIAAESLPFPGCVAALDALAADGATFVVCTNKRTDLAIALLDALGLSPRFGAIIGPDVAGAAKPDARHLLHALAAVGGSAARAVMVGDAATDVGVARNAGVPSIALSFGYSDVPPEELGADLLIHHFDELPAAARRLLGA